MPFSPNPNEKISIDGIVYSFTEHPSAPGMPYGQEGRQAVVYQLTREGMPFAIKVFKPRFRLPSLVAHARLIAPLANIAGLKVCQRTVLSPSKQADLLKQHPDLVFAVLMPWVEGDTWQNILLERRALSPDQSLRLARAFASTLLELEEQGVAHCDLSAANVILTLPTSGTPAIYLVDVEGIFASGLPRPEALPAGSPGYAFCTASQGLWSQSADRFAGSLLLAEILAWCSPELRAAADGESYFNPGEIQKPGTRYDLLVSTLTRTWGNNIAALLQRAWQATVLEECPTFGEWLVALPDKPIVSITDGDVPASNPSQQIEEGQLLTIQTLIDAARRLQKLGNPIGAMEVYRQILTLCPPGSGMQLEIQTQIDQLVTEERVKPASAISSRSTLHCPNCDQAIPIDAKICPFCEELLETKPVKRGFSWNKAAAAAGIFIILSLFLIIVANGSPNGLVGIFSSPTYTRTATPIPSNTSTQTKTFPPTITMTASSTLTPSPSTTPTLTLTPTITTTLTSSPSPSRTRTATQPYVPIVCANNVFGTWRGTREGSYSRNISWILYQTDCSVFGYEVDGSFTYNLSGWVQGNKLYIEHTYGGSFTMTIGDYEGKKSNLLTGSSSQGKYFLVLSR